MSGATVILHYFVNRCSSHHYMTDSCEKLLPEENLKALPTAYIYHHTLYTSHNTSVIFHASWLDTLSLKELVSKNWELASSPWIVHWPVPRLGIMSPRLFIKRHSFSFNSSSLAASGGFQKIFSTRKRYGQTMHFCLRYEVLISTWSVLHPR